MVTIDLSFLADDVSAQGRALRQMMVHIKAIESVDDPVVQSAVDGLLKTGSELIKNAFRTMRHSAHLAQQLRAFSE